MSPATIWIGTDDGLLEIVADADEQLTAFGCTIERLPDLGHTFPTDFTDRVRQVLEN